MKEEGSSYKISYWTMKKRGKGKGKKIAIVKDVSVDGAVKNWEKSTQKFCGVFSPF